MKRPRPILLLFLAVSAVLSSPVFFSRNSKTPLKKNTQEAVQKVKKVSSPGLISLTGKFLTSGPVRQLCSIDRSILLSLPGKYISEQIPAHAPPMEPLALVSRNAALILDIRDAAATGRAFLASPLGRALNEIQWRSVMQRLRIKPSLRRPLERTTSGLMELLTHPDFPEIFSRQVVVARLAAPFSLPRREKENTLPDNLLILLQCGPDDPQAVQSALLNMLGGKRATRKYYGFTITSLRLKDKKQLYLVPVGQYVALSFARQPVRQSIDLFLHHIFTGQSGFRQEDYTRLREHRSEKNELFLYADLFRFKLHHGFMNALSGAENNNQPPENRPWAAGVRSMGFFYHAEGPSLHFRAVTRFSENQLRPFQRRIYTRSPIRNHSLQATSADQIISFWCNWLEPQLWWQTTVARGEEGELAAAARMTDWINQQIGMDMETFWGLFGREFGFNVTAISTAGFFPVPRICFSIAVRNQEKLEFFLRKITAGLPVKRDQIASIPVVSLLAANGMLQPSYAFVNGNLLVADSREQLEDILLQRKKSLLQDTDFQAVLPGTTEPANLHLFARIAELVTALQELASWAGTMIAVRDPKTGAKSKILVDQIIVPLLESLKMYRAMGVSSVTRPDEVIVDATVLRTEETQNDTVPLIKKLGKQPGH